MATSAANSHAKHDITDLDSSAKHCICDSSIACYEVGRKTMSATAPGSDNQPVSNQDIQQILTEVRALNRRMDTLNTRLFGPRSFGARRRRRRRRALRSEKGVCSAGILPALFTYIHEFLALLRFLPAAGRRETLSQDGQGPPRLRCRSEAQTLSLPKGAEPKGRRACLRSGLHAQPVVSLPNHIPDRTEELAWVLAALYGVNQLEAFGQWLRAGRPQPPYFSSDLTCDQAFCKLALMKS